tara:strand:- start:4520 stop:4936 length:417 start_codon:yes stop_codon:yes gene_type:complete
MSIKDTAKALLEKGVATGDEELINLANELLESLTPPKPSKKSGLDEDYIAPAKNENAQSDSQGRRAKTEPIDAKKRENEFVDDGTEHKDEVTPDYIPSPRGRKAFEKVKVVCTRCNKNLDVHPVHKRENYICSSCIKK